MSGIYSLETDRLILRQWCTEDYLPFAAMNADPEVMKFYPKALTREESDAFANKVKDLIEQRGWGCWALELKSDKSFIGYVGLHKPEWDLPFAPCVEIGWRLAKSAWGQGYATEAAKDVLKFAFEDLELDEVVSFTSVINMRSQRVMQRLNMGKTQQTFEHTALPEGQPLRTHVLYKLTKTQWLNSQ